MKLTNHAIASVPAVNNDRLGESPHPHESSVADPNFRRLSWPSRALLIDCAKSSMKSFNTLKTTDTGMKGAQETR